MIVNILSLIITFLVVWLFIWQFKKIRKNINLRWYKNITID